MTLISPYIPVSLYCILILFTQLHLTAQFRLAHHHHHGVFLSLSCMCVDIVADFHDWCRKAAELYKEAGRGSAAAEALSKAAKLIEDRLPQVLNNNDNNIFSRCSSRLLVTY